MNYQSKYGLYDCWKCLCEVCTRIGCPKCISKSELGHCVAMYKRDACPTVKCDWFVHKEIHKVYRIKRKYKKPDRVAHLLEEILVRLDDKGRG